MAPPVADAHLVDSLATLLASLLVGGVGIAVGTGLVVGDGDLVRGTITAGIGALVWALLDGVILIGPILALLAWIGVVKVRHDTGWLGAGVAGLVAWIVAGVLVFALALVGLPVTHALGIPGV